MERRQAEGPRIEAYAASLAQAGRGRAPNEDGFLIQPGPPPLLAVADGAGAAEQAARRVLRLLARQTASAAGGEFAVFSSWAGWFRILDAAQVGGAESTLAAVAVLDGDRLAGAVAGDSRVYVWRRDGTLEWLSDAASKHRIGSGGANPLPLHAPFERGDILVLLTDGAWSPLSFTRLRDAIARAAPQPLALMPERLLAEASRHGRADDMTALVAKRR